MERTIRFNFRSAFHSPVEAKAGGDHFCYMAQLSVWPSHCFSNKRGLGMGPRSPSYKVCNRNPRIRWSGSNIDSTRHGLANHTAGDHLSPAAHPAYHAECDAFPCFKVGSVLDRLSTHKHYPATIWRLWQGSCWRT